MISVRTVGIVPTCEAGLFDSSFTCDATETTRCQVGSCVVQLCVTHRNVITMKPIADE